MPRPIIPVPLFVSSSMPLAVLASIAAITSRQQSLPRHVIHLKPDAVGILEQHRVIPRRPWAVFRRMHDLCADRFQKAVNLIDVAALARAQTYVMQSDAPLLEFLRAK